MFTENAFVQHFLGQLKDRGISCRVLWSAKRSSSARYDDIAFVAFSGDNFQPRVLTAIVIDYGTRDGFGLFIDPGSRDIGANVDLIAGAAPPRLKEFRTNLISAHFAFNCAEGDAAALASMFESMTAEEAAAIIANPSSVSNPNRNTLAFPTALLSPVH